MRQGRAPIFAEASMLLGPAAGSLFAVWGAQKGLEPGT